MKMIKKAVTWGVTCCWLEDEYGYDYGYVYHDDYYIILHTTLTILSMFCLLMHIIVIGANIMHGLSLIKIAKIIKVNDQLLVAMSLAHQTLVPYMSRSQLFMNTLTDQPY
jgi:hypothetical protein